MDPQSLVIILRMVERILGVGLGGLLIYFGYRLFLDVRSKRGGDGGSGDFSFAGGNKIKLSKVGPGVFFALFGAGLVLFSLTRTVSLTTTGPAPAAARVTPESTKESPVIATTTVKFIGATGTPETDQERQRRREEIQQDIVTLNRALERAHGAERGELERAITRSKLALMEPLWADDWGDLADFRDWLEKGGAARTGTESAVSVFQKK